MYIAAPGRRELTAIIIISTITIIVFGNSITHIALKNEVSKLRSENASLKLHAGNEPFAPAVRNDSRVLTASKGDVVVLSTSWLSLLPILGRLYRKSFKRGIEKAV